MKSQRVGLKPMLVWLSLSTMITAAHFLFERRLDSSDLLAIRMLVFPHVVGFLDSVKSLICVISFKRARS